MKKLAFKGAVFAPRGIGAGAAGWSGSQHPAWVFAQVLLPFALAHLISFLFRSVNAVVYTDLSQELSLAADSIGLLTGIYFLSFALAQLPVGLALDRYGPRRVQIPLLLVAAGGAVVFAQAHTLTDLMIGRALIGFGVAGSMMAALKAGSLWLPKEKLPLVASTLMAVGGMGAMASTTPLQTALHHTDWRGVFVALGLGTVLVSALIFAVVPEHPRKQVTRLGEMVGAIGQLYRSWSFWRLALYSVVAHASCLAVQGLWIGPWLRDVGGLSRAEMADVLFAATAAMIAGSVFFGWISDKLRRQGYGPMLVCGGGLWVFVAVQALMVFVPGIDGTMAAVLAVAFSFFGMSASMNFAIVAQSVPQHLTGRASTAFNLLVCLLAFLLQWWLGGLLKMWAPVDGHYPVQAYQYALGALLLLQIPGLLLWTRFKA